MVNKINELIAKFKGPEIAPEVAGDIEKIDSHAYRMAWIDDKTLDFWNRPFSEVYYTKLKKRLLGGDNSVYGELSNEDLYPLVSEMRDTTHQVYMPVKPRYNRDIEHDTIRLGKGQAVTHFDELFPTGKFDKDFINPLNFTLVEAELDPMFNIEISDEDGRTLRDEFTIEMNINTLRGFFNNSQRAQGDLERRGYKIKAEETITFNYTLEGLPGRRKEIPAIPLSV